MTDRKTIRLTYRRKWGLIGKLHFQHLESAAVKEILYSKLNLVNGKLYKAAVDVGGAVYLITESEAGDPGQAGDPRPAGEELEGVAKQHTLHVRDSLDP